MRRPLAAFFLAVAMVAPLPATAAAGVATGVFHPPVQWVGHNNVKSSNWSGYAVQDTGKFSKVVGTWVQPTAKCASGTQYSSFWVGIDGYTSSSVEQLGTDSDCNGATPSYYAWYEMYPANSVYLSKTKYPVKPGDTLTGTVSRSGTTYTLSLKNSRGWTFSFTMAQSGLANSSAEWIVEAPEICSLTCSLAKLADYGTVKWSASEAAVGGALQPVSKFTDNSGPHSITMASGSTVKSQPGALGTTGETFSVVWHHA